MEFVNQLQVIGMLIALILFCYQWRVKANRSLEGKRKQIPTPPWALPIIGHLYLLGGQKPTHRTLAAMADKYGPAILLNLGMHRTLVVSNWELVKECFTTNDKVFATRPPFPAAKYLGYNGTMSGSSPYGTYWRGIRKFFTLELLSKARLEKLKHVRVSTVDVAIKEVYSCWVKDGCSKPVKLEMGQWFEHLSLNLITCRNINQFIAAAVDTTSIILTWAVSFLMNNHHELQRAQDELDIHVGRNRNVEEYDIKNLSYLNAIIKETLRLCPPAPLALPHEAMEDCQVGGYHVLKGTRLVVNLWKLHRDSRVWQDSDEFKHERFLTTHQNIDTKGQTFELIPFGSGMRVCPGLCPGFHLATQFLHLTLARLLHAFNLDIAPDNLPVDMTEGLGFSMTKASPIEILFSPRLPSQLY